MHDHLSETLRRALNHFARLTGVDPQARSFTIVLGADMDAYTVSRMYTMIEEALTLDPSNITAYLLLDAVSTQYLSKRVFSVDELLEDPRRTQEYVAAARAFRDLVRSPEILSIGADFVLKLRQAIRHYDAETKPIISLLRCAPGRAKRRRVVPGRRARVRIAAVAQGRESRSCGGDMQSAWHTPSSHSS